MTNNRDALLLMLDNAWDRYHRAEDTDKAAIEREICKIRLSIAMIDLCKSI